MQKYLEKMQKLFRLQDWDITYLEDPNNGHEGSALMVHNMDCATIKVNKKLTDEEKEKTIIHELLHLINRNSNDLACENIENEAIRNTYDRYHERAIEKQAQIIYKLMK